ncbi:MAG: hypothetical protein ABSC55_04860 [Syntrophorhabdales bacterium]|jgi:hypothetical protein
MKVPAALLLIPERVWLFIFTGIFFLGAVASYVLHTDASAVEQKIVSKQREVSSVLQLKETYETRKRSIEKSLQRTESVGMSLASVEGIVTKTLVGGKLTMLKPATLKEEKGTQQMAIELTVTGAPLGEVVSFLKAVETAGFHVKRLQLTVPQANPTALDMHVIMAQV